MTIEREGCLTRFVCDGARCRNCYEVHDESFQASWQEAKDAGWVVTRDRDEWRHYCPKCKKDLGDD